MQLKPFSDLSTKPFQRDFYLGKSYLGSATYTPDSRGAYSEVYICPTCGADWCRTVVEGAPWMPLRSLCKLHARPYFVLQYDEALPLGGQEATQTIATATPELLNYILLRLLDAALQLNEDNNVL